MGFNYVFRKKKLEVMSTLDSCVYMSLIITIIIVIINTEKGMITLCLKKNDSLMDVILILLINGHQFLYGQLWL